MFEYSVIGEFIQIAKSGHRKWKGHRLHPESDTIPMNQFRFDHVSIGKGTYGELNVVDFGGECNLILKNYISIAQRVTFLLNGEHYINHISTYPFKVKLLHIQDSESFGKGDIVVDDDVWIGYGATILSGVHIGQGAVIAAGAVVTNDVPPYAIVGGNPAKVIKMRFAEPIVKELMQLEFERIDSQFASENKDELYSNVSNIDQVQKFVQKCR